MQKRRIRMQLLTLIDNFLRYLVFYLKNNCYIINILNLHNSEACFLCKR